MRGRRPLPVEDDGLQADVMRFMAIIAFCLVAILALVRQVEPEATSDGSALPSASTRTPSPSEAGLDAAPEAAPETVAPKPPQDPVTVTQPAPWLRPAEPQPAAEPPMAADNPEQGLVLRFASDSDFLRLVNSGRLEVFAFSDDGPWRLHPGLSLQPAGAPGALHELLPSTLPAAMLAALKQERGEAMPDRWGMRMPSHMEAQIRGHLRSATRGALIIDRNGDIRHETDG